MTKLEPGEKPPQFIIFSFDGAGSHQRWSEFMAAADATNSRFTGFLSGHLPDRRSGKDAGAYTGPGHATGKASIGYGGPESEIVTEVNDLNLAYSKGHEIGTHYNGHFCDDNPPGGNQWNTADWENELDQFFTFMTDWKTLNGYTDAPDLQVPIDAIKGGRTPCLTGSTGRAHPGVEGVRPDLRLVDARPVHRHRVARERRRDLGVLHAHGLLARVSRAPRWRWTTTSGSSSTRAARSRRRRPELRDIVKKTYDYMYDQAYNGNRAPVLIANHFNKWNGDSFNPPAMDFMKEKCGQPDTYCATYQDVIAWMELQDPAVLAELQAQAPVAGTAP